MPKKKTRHINKITPAVDSDDGVEFGKLKVGECFLMNGSLYMSESSDPNHNAEQSALNLATGLFIDGLCGIQVQPVNITIAWKKK